MADSPTVVLVGHCGPDMHLLKSAVTRALPGVRIASANDEATLERLAAPDSILLINRVLDGDFSSDEGVDLIKEMRQRTNPPSMMLISNHESAQSKAVAAGALPGFGKSHLYRESTMQLLREAMT